MVRHHGSEDNTRGPDDTGAASAERRSPRRKARPTTVSNIEELLSTGSSLSESRVSAFPRFPGSKGLPGTQSPAGLRRQPKCVVDSTTQGSLASLPKSFKPTRFATFAGNKKTPSWVFVTIEVWSRLWPSTVTGRRSYRNTHALFHDLSRRMNVERLSLIVTDGFEFYQKVIRRFFGPACLYGQVLKTRRNDRIIKVERRALHGAAWRFEDALNNSEDSSTLNTSFIERLNLTIRQSSAYLSRRTLSHARSTERLDEHLELLRYYHTERNHQGLGNELLTPLPASANDTGPIVSRERLGGILNYYCRAA